MSKKLFQKRFKELYPKKRLLAIQLNGFSHRVFYDDGKKNNDIQIEEYSAYTGNNGLVKELFKGFGHTFYQNNAEEIIYVMPNKR